MSKLAHSNQPTMDEIARRAAIEDGNEDLIAMSKPREFSQETAAAMYEALKTAVLVLEALPADDESLYGPRALVEAYAALAKAEGRTP